MRRLLLLLWLTPLSALPLNNPIQSVLICDSTFCHPPCGATLYGIFNMRFGFYGDYVYDTAMKVRRGHRDDTIQNLSVMTNAGEFDVTLYGFDLFCVVGTSKIKMETPLSTFQTNTAGGNTQLEVIGSSEVSWGIGGRSALWQRGHFGIGIEGEFFTTNPHITQITDFGSGFVNYLNNGIEMRYRAGQIGMGVNWDITLQEQVSLDPYFGLFWTYSTLEFGDVALTGLGTNANQNIRLYDIKKTRQYGWAIGTTLVKSSQATLTIEGRFGGETAAFVSGQLQF